MDQECQMGALKDLTVRTFGCSICTASACTESQAEQ